LAILTAVDGGARRGWWIGLAAGSAALLALAIGLTMAAAGPGPGLAASAAPPPASPSPHPVSIPPCTRDESCVVIGIEGPALSDAQKASAQPRAGAILRAVSGVNWGDPRNLTAADAAVKEALARAGFPDAEVMWVRKLIRYVVPILPACVVGYLAPGQASPISQTIYGAHSNGDCSLDR
jgi:hypothetical protein